MDLADAAGLCGVFLMLVAYAAVTMGRLDPQKVLALSANLVGSCLVIYSLTRHFNLSAMVMESVWALVALIGFVRLGLRRRRGFRR